MTMLKIESNTKFRTTFGVTGSVSITFGRLTPFLPRSWSLCLRQKFEVEVFVSFYIILGTLTLLPHLEQHVQSYMGGKLTSLTYLCQSLNAKLESQVSLETTWEKFQSVTLENFIFNFFICFYLTKKSDFHHFFFIQLFSELYIA